MIGMVLVTHGRLAIELRSAMEHVVGSQRNVDTVCIGPDDDMDNRRAEIEACIGRCDTGDGVVLLTDMFGGTPCNLAISMMERKGVEVIAGVNLPMLVEIAKARSTASLPDCVARATAAGKHYISSASDVLANADIQTSNAKSSGIQSNGRQVNGRVDRPGYSSCPGTPPATPRSGIAAAGPSSPYEIGSAAAHRAAMTQNADAPSRP